jgi:hypothetical protein
MERLRATTVIVLSPPMLICTSANTWISVSPDSIAASASAWLRTSITINILPGWRY